LIDYSIVEGSSDLSLKKSIVMDDVILKTIVIEDSDTQRVLVSKLVSAHPNLILEGTYSNGLEAYGEVDDKKVDLVFLAIEMPIINGFDIAKLLHKSIQIIFICSNPDHALKAFEYDATDFVQKPIEVDRFKAAVHRAVTNHMRVLGVTIKEEFIYVHSDLWEKKVILNQINWVEALGDYVKLCTEKGNLLVYSTMKSFSERLPADKFIRVHRSYTVNIKKVEKFCSTSVEICGRQMPVSRKKSDALERALTTA